MRPFVRFTQAIGAIVLVLATALVGSDGPMTASLATPKAGRVTLSSLQPSGQPVGDTVNWVATASGMTNPIYRFSVAADGAEPNVVRDYSVFNTFPWVPHGEGTYTVQVSA